MQPEGPLPVIPPDGSGLPIAAGAPAAPPVPAPKGPPPRRGGAGRLILLLGLLAAVTAGAIVGGRSLQRGAKHAATTTTTTTTTTPKPKPKPKPVPWGLIPAKLVGRFTGGGDQPVAVLAGGRLFVIGGTGRASVLAGPPTGKLAALASLPGPRAAAAAFVTGRNIDVIGGESGKATTDSIVKIDVSTGKVRSAGKFEEPLAEAGFASGKSSVYLAGGWTGSKYATAIVKFTPPKTVALLARLPQGLRSPAVALIGHTLYVAGGRSQTGLSRKVYALNLLTGKLTTVGKLPQAVDRALLVVVAGKLYLLGGRTAAGKPVDSVVQIDPAKHRSSPAGRMPFPLAGAAAVIEGAHAFVVVPAGSIYRLG